MKPVHQKRRFAKVEVLRLIPLTYVGLFEVKHELFDRPSDPKFSAEMPG